MRTYISRRSILRGAGIAVGLPLLDAMLPRSSAAELDLRPARMLFVYTPNGVNIEKWVPTQTGDSYELSPSLEVLKRHRQDFTVMSGLGHPHSKGGHAGADTFLTGADLGGSPGYDYRNSISVDQVAAEIVGRKTRFPSLELSAAGGTGSPGHSHTLAFSRDAIPLPAESNPRAVFNRTVRGRLGRHTSCPTPAISRRSEHFGCRSRTSKSTEPKIGEA